MALRRILHYPDERLHTVARPVTQFDESLKALVRDMAETMYAAPGIGLAATQIDVHLRVITIDISETRDELVVLVNPEIVEREGSQECEEGCLSVPGVYENVVRAQKVKVRAYDAEGNYIGGAIDPDATSEGQEAWEQYYAEQGFQAAAQAALLGRAFRSVLAGGHAAFSLLALPCSRSRWRRSSSPARPR